MKKDLRIVAAWIIVLSIGLSQMSYLGSSLASLGLSWSVASRLRGSTPISAEMLEPEMLGAKEIVTETPLRPCEVALNNVAQGQMPDRLVISLAELDLTVNPVSLVDGTWAVHDNVANYAQETDLPNGVSGNTGLFGHDRTYAFAPIKRLSTDNEIQLFTRDYIFFYHVIEVHSGVDSKEVDVFHFTQEPQLTLVTCDGIFSKQRFVVKARLVKIEKRECVPSLDIPAKSLLADYLDGT
ncbi:sortase [Patescibacteria group bacterium]|nr:sortase [Patescibacteria group bacterium]